MLGQKNSVDNELDKPFFNGYENRRKAHKYRGAELGHRVSFIVIGPSSPAKHISRLKFAMENWFQDGRICKIGIRFNLTRSTTIVSLTIT